jgi:hypothetical protein
VSSSARLLHIKQPPDCSEGRTCTELLLQSPTHLKTRLHFSRFATPKKAQGLHQRRGLRQYYSKAQESALPAALPHCSTLASHRDPLSQGLHQPLKRKNSMAPQTSGRCTVQAEVSWPGVI